MNEPEKSAIELEVLGLTKAYHTRARQTVLALDNVNLRLCSGEIIGLLGPNGAGKTTFIKILSGLVLPTRGEVRIGGTDVLARPQNLFARVGVTLEGNRNIYWRLSIEENLAYFGALRGLHGRYLRQRIEEVLAFIDLQAERKALGKDLSRGMQQRVAIGVALLHDPPVLLLDEPMLGLDVYSCRQLRGKLRDLAAQGRLVLLSTHQMRDAQELCDSVVIMNRGRIMANDSVRNLLGFFAATLYTIRLREPPNAWQVGQLQELSRSVEVEDDRIRILIEEPAMLYRAIEILKKTWAPIASIDDEANLEDIFVTLTRVEQGSINFAMV